MLKKAQIPTVFLASLVYFCAISQAAEAIDLASREKAHHLTKQAREYIRGGDAVGAIKLLDQALFLNPNSCEAHIKKADALCMQEKWDFSIANCNDALKLEPGNGQALYRRGVCLAAKHKFDQALADLTLSIDADKSKRPSRYFARAEIYRRKGALAPAISDYHAAIDSADTPDIVTYSYLSAAECYRVSGDRKKERVELSNLIKADPENVDAYRLRGDSFAKDGDNKAAGDNYRLALKLEPDNTHCLAALKALTKTK